MSSNSSRTLPSWDPRWKRRYNSPPDDLIQDFYIPAFARSMYYDRAVGFFSSSILVTIASAIDEFLISGGKMRLITSPANLTDEDLRALGKGERLAAELQAGLEHQLASADPPPAARDRLALLTWMVANGRLEVRIALREHTSYYSLFHEKIGVFVDMQGNWMTFTGSPNETKSGALRHSESFPLHRSWANEEQLAYAVEERERFDAIWRRDLPEIPTWDATAWLADPLRKEFGSRQPSLEKLVPKEARVDRVRERQAMILMPALPTNLVLRPYQREAVNQWLRASGRGIFAMATGTGKTITALAAATQVSFHAAEQERPLLIIVVAPLTDLLRQWRETAEWFGFRPAVCHSNLRKEEEGYLRTVFSAARVSRGKRAEMVITTAASLTPRGDTNRQGHFLQRQLRRHAGLLLVIGDEMHSLGTPSRLAALPRDAAFRLGLSATPKRHGDEAGTTALMEYFGDAIAKISIKDAIYKYQALVPYDYHPHRVLLTSEELGRYAEISRRIAAAFASGGEEAAEPHIRRRTRLIQHAHNKMAKLEGLMRGGLDRATHQLIYVAEGKYRESELRQVHAVRDLLSEEFGMETECYYGDTSPQRREFLQQQLAAEEIQALIAMKCLDEGVDIPSARVGVIMASTRNPRQFIQRRGRILRQDPNRPKAYAVVHDMIVLPPAPEEPLTESEQTLIGGELSRAVELADAARNREVKLDLIEWAYDFRLDEEQFTWMRLAENEEMEEWLP